MAVNAAALHIEVPIAGKTGPREQDRHGWYDRGPSEFTPEGGRGTLRQVQRADGELASSCDF